MNAKKALLIVNPYSGRKNGTRIGSYIAEQMQHMGYICTPFISETTEHLRSFVSQNHPDKFDCIGIIGGDGTMHEFINAAFTAFGSFKTPVALFPCGTGNAFNLDIGCLNVDDTLETIRNNSISPVDVAEVNYADTTLWSFNIVGVGLVADINDLAERMRWLGGSRYTIASLIKLMRNRTLRAHVTSEEYDAEEEISFVLACNTRYTGKGMMMAPLATLHDGKFDVLIVKACSRLKLLRLFPKIFKGAHLDSDVLHYTQCTHLSVHGAAFEHTNIDGEMKGNAPFSFRVHQHKLYVFTG